MIRGEDLLPSAPKALLIWAALDEIAASGKGGSPVALPKYAHLPMLVNERREKISKRRDDVAIESYRAQGFLAEAIANYLALLGWGHPDGIEVFRISRCGRESFSLEHVHHAPAFFDVVKLRHLNSEHIRGLSSEEFVNITMPWLVAEAEVFEHPTLEGIVAGRAAVAGRALRPGGVPENRPARAAEGLDAVGGPGDGRLLVLRASGDGRG